MSKDADALYIQLQDGQFECCPVHVTAEITLDFTAGEKLVGIEVLGASSMFQNPEAPAIELQHLLPKIAA